MNSRLQELVLERLSSGKWRVEDGEVINRRGRRLGSIFPDGRYYLGIRDPESKMLRRVGRHQVVWLQAHGQVDGQIRHIDGNASNNRLENLHYRGRAAPITPMGRPRKLSDEQIEEIRSTALAMGMRGTGNRSGGITLQELADRYSVSSSMISRIVSGNRRTQ